MEKVVSIRQMVEDLELKVLAGEDGLDREVLLLEIHRPGIEVTGYFVSQDNEREIENSIHVIGGKEIKYIDSLPKYIKEYNLTHYFSYDFPCLIATENVYISDDMLNIAKITTKPVLLTEDSSEKFIKKLRRYLERELAPEIVLNNFTLLEVFGTGILLVGDESAKIGTTIELLEKNHRYITDELLVIKRVGEDMIIGENGYNQKSEDYNYYMNLMNDQRISIIDYFGIGAIRNSKQIELIIKLEKWDEAKFYDRLGVDEQRQYILGIEIPKIILPVRKGRNLAIIIETAAINQRLKKLGQNSAIYFLEQTQKMIKENAKKRGGDKRMEQNKVISVRKIKERFDLRIIAGEEYVDDKMITCPDLHRPSLEFAGFYDILDENGKDNIQIIGESEMVYINKMTKEKVNKNIIRYFEYKFPCIIFVGVKEIPEWFVARAKESAMVMLATDEKMNKFVNELTDNLDAFFAPTMTMHGVLVEVFGFGVLLIGKSGIGKSETALELIHRGHRLIADDMVKFTKSVDGRIVGTAEKIPYFMEIRGLGIIDIKTLYGLGAVRNSKQLDAIIELKEMKDEDYLTTTEDIEKTMEIMDEKIIKIDLSISSGRNAASMVEIATMNLRAKRVGYDSNKIYMNNYEVMSKITTKKESIFQNIGNIITGGKTKK